MFKIKYKILNRYFDQRLGISTIIVKNLENDEKFNMYFDEDMFLIMKKNVEERDIYLAYLDYIETHEFNYHYKKHQLETIPRKYKQMYYEFSKYYAENYNKEVEAKLDKALDCIEDIKDYLEICEEETVQSYYNKMSRLNSAEFELNKIRKLTK